MIITLAPVLDLVAAETLRTELLEGFSVHKELTVDAGQVQRISSPALQVLAAAVRHGAVLSNISPALSDTARTLDLTAALGLESHV